MAVSAILNVGYWQYSRRQWINSVIFVQSVYYKKLKKKQNGGEMKFDKVLTETNLHSFLGYGVQQKNSWIYYRSSWYNVVARQTSFRDNESDSTLLTSVCYFIFMVLMFKFVAYVTHDNWKSHVGTALTTWVVNYTCLWTLGVVTNCCRQLFTCLY